MKLIKVNGKIKYEKVQFLNRFIFNLCVLTENSVKILRNG